MKVLILSAPNPYKTSGILALDLFNSLKKQGFEVKMLVNTKDPIYPNDIVCLETWIGLWTRKIGYKINKLLFGKSELKTNPKYHFHNLRESKSRYSTEKILKATGFVPDVIIAFFVGDFINSKNFYELYSKTHAKIFWLMYDTAPLTGGCHYSWDCFGYQQNCGKCPGLYSSDENDISYQNMMLKKKYLSNIDITLVPASEWQVNQLRKSSIFSSKMAEKIMTAIDPEVFKPIDNTRMRTAHGLVNKEKVVFFGAVSLLHERKGMNFLIKALNELNELIRVINPDLKVKLLIAGKDFEEILVQVPFEYINLGMLDNNYGIASAYQLADIFVCPSIEDAGPTMINQSIMSGTPVVCFEMGVAWDLVIDNYTGFKVELKNSKKMAEAIFKLLTMTHEESETLKKNCRELALKTISPVVNFKSWLNLITDKNEKSSNLTI